MNPDFGYESAFSFRDRDVRISAEKAILVWISKSGFFLRKTISFPTGKI